jgi:signal transduction histidine kinase/FixJ family two-component response regulator
MNANDAKFEWLSGGGELSDLIRANDWSATPLGPIESWPQSLRTTVSLCLASNFPINIIWGPDAIQIYNAGYRVLCGAAHPRAIGESYRTTWASAWPVIGEPFEKARRGETSYLENQRMFLERNGYLEETFFTFSLSPIRDELGGVAGLFHPVTETTAAMLSDRRARALGDVANKAGSADSIQEAATLIIETLAEYRGDLSFVMVYQYESADDLLRLLGETGIPADAHVGRDPGGLDGAPWPLREVVDGGRGTLVPDVVARVGEIACADYPEPVSRAFVLPVRTSPLAPAFGFAVVGLSTRLPFDETYERFLEMLGGVMGTAMGAALAYEKELRRSADLAALDEAKTTFFSNVSHEFRTPLTLMLGPLEDSLADTQEPLPPGLLKLVNTLLDFSRIQAGRVEAAYRPTDLSRMTADLASVFRAAIEEAGVTYRVEMEDLGEPVFVDHGMWEKIVLNLLSNAFKFTFVGEIEVRLQRRGQNACLTVRDTGSGIPTRELPNLFQRFHRVEGSPGRTYEGSGIGLALIHELVKLHGGTIGARSQEGAGTTFEVSIPLGSAHLTAERLSHDAAPSVPGPMRAAFIEEAAGWLPDAPETSPDEVLTRASAPGAPGAAAARQRIVVAEDNADMRAYLTGLLEAVGEVEAVENGEVALASIRRHRPDLVVSDVMMPRLDGLGLLARLRADAATAGIPFVLLSAKAGEESRLAGLHMGADDFLVKPFSARELVARAMTQLKLGEARRSAETERNRLHEFFMQAPIPMVILLGQEHRFFLANEPYEKLIGQKVVGRTVLELFPTQETDLFIPLLDEVYATGRPFVGRALAFRLPDAQGVLHDGFIDVSYYPFREASSEIRGILAIVLDVSEQVRARRTIEDTVAQLTSERELRERFVMTLSHDLRAPLTVLKMGGELLQSKLDDREALKRLATRIVRNAERADAMIRDLLDANRLKAGERMPLSVKQSSLDQILETIAQGLTELHGARFHVTNEAGAVPGQWDGDAIRRVVENLAGNAIKYGTRDAPITLRLIRGPDWVELAIHNEGDAISASEQAAIFEPFHRTRSAASSEHSGWGVGLTLVRGIAEAHGGSTRVESDTVGGTTFFVRLPAGGRAVAE